MKRRAGIHVETRLVTIVRTKKVMIKLEPEISNMSEPGVDFETRQMAEYPMPSVTREVRQMGFTQRHGTYKH